MGDFHYTMLDRDDGTKVGAHSITINGMNTWDIWHMAPKSRPFVSPPQVKTEYVDVPGADGALDYTEVLTGRPRYANRTGQWDFIVDNGYRNWSDLYSDILMKLHGKYFDNIVLEDDPYYKWKGRLSVSGQFGNKDYSAITIQYNLDPYKRSIESEETSNWRWNDLFGNTIYYGTFNVNGKKAHNILNNTSTDVTAYMTCTSNFTVYTLNEEHDVIAIAENQSFVGYPSRQLLPGDNTMILKPGDNYLYFVGNGTIKVSYERGGIL